MTDSIAAAKLAIYIILSQPAFYCLFKHGKTGFLGWFYVQLFCILRVVTGALGLHGSNTSTTTAILSSIGLSPLLLAASGILHEARRATNPRLNRRIDICLEIQYHILTATAMVLVIIALLNLKTSDSVDTMKTLIQIGSGLITLAWLLLVVWALCSLKKKHSLSRLNETSSMRNGNKLLNAVFLSLPLIGLRLGYALASLELRISASNSGFLTSRAVEVCLNMVPEMIVVAIFLIAGIRTRSLNQQIKEQDYTPPEDQGHVLLQTNKSNGQGR